MGDDDRRAVVLLGQRRGLSSGKEPAVAAPNRPMAVDRGFKHLSVGDQPMAQGSSGRSGSARDCRQSARSPTLPEIAARRPQQYPARPLGRLRSGRCRRPPPSRRGAGSRKNRTQLDVGKNLNEWVRAVLSDLWCRADMAARRHAGRKVMSFSSGITPDKAISLVMMTLPLHASPIGKSGGLSIIKSKRPV